MSGLLLGSLAFAQRARPAPEALGEPFSAPRLLFDLTQGDANRGVALAGDLDDDGDCDLLAGEFISTGSLYPRALQTWLSDGSGRYVHALTTSLGFTPSFGESVLFLQLADVTDDGILDLVYLRRRSPDSVRIHPGVGDGGFGDPLVIPGYGNFIFAVSPGDCDGDGDADLLVHDSANALDQRESLTWWHHEAGAFVPETPLLLESDELELLDGLHVDGDGIQDAVGVLGSVVQFYRTVGSVPVPDASVVLPSVFDNDFRIHTGDLDGDGLDDVLVVKSDAPNDLFHYLPILNEGGAFALAGLQSEPSSPVPDRDGALVDWDGDGDLDYLSATWVWSENTGGARFEAAGVVRGVSGFQAPHPVADLDGDGHLDAICRWSWFRGDGTFPRRNSTTWTNEVSSVATLTTVRGVLEDWEGDGDLDFIDPEVLYLNDGDASFVERETDLARPPAPHDQYVLTSWGDFDGDGLRDVVAASISFDNTFLGMKLLRGTEAGAYVLSSTVPSPSFMVVVGPTRSRARDLDADGDIDILTRDGFWQNDGDGHFGGLPVAAYTGTLVAAVDLEHDGDLDLLVDGGSPGTTMRLLRNAGGLVFEETVVGPSGSAASFVDLDADVDLDLVVTDTAAESVRVYEQDVPGNLVARGELPVLGAEGPAASIDVDGDGLRDLVVGGRFDGFGFLSTTPIRVVTAWIRGPGLTYVEHLELSTEVVPLAFDDLDRDGDVEVLGHRPNLGGSSLRLLENLRFDGPKDGSAVQYGLDLRTPGTGGLHPILGSRRPVRPGRDAEFVIRGGLGGASGFLLRGPARASVLGGGFHNLVQAPEIVYSFHLDGATGVAGAGAHVVRRPITYAILGRTFAYQAVIVDPGASAGLSATNGLEVRYGDLPEAR
ncbi:MAG TPA: VCBS repeat-containing protein [Planctomycetota bacterium]